MLAVVPDQVVAVVQVQDQVVAAAVQDQDQVLAAVPDQVAAVDLDRVVAAVALDQAVESQSSLRLFHPISVGKVSEREIPLVLK